METRVERAQKRKAEVRRQVWKIPQQLFFLMISLLAYTFSLAFWYRALSGTEFYDMLDTIIRINIATIGLFIGLGYMNLRFFIVLVKSLTKILFTVWIVLLVQFSSMDQVEQNAWILLSAFFFVYLDVALEINDSLFQVKDDFKVPKLHFITAAFIREHSIAISILLLSIINGVLSHYIIGLLEVIKVG